MTMTKIASFPDFDFQQPGAFRKMIASVQETTGWSDARIAEIAMASRGVVRRWKAGVYAPSVQVQASIRCALYEAVEAEIAAEESAA